ncbi:hypothetical protein ALC53_00203 [Atta colombica]|uniref:Uncharacterized protein n=1 Tax=Atta colombica TaxID=520822 RepID=A0A195BXF0_9HYME|nr:hypothetical protein ALC53_00203 [Atta colombica]
MRYAIALLTPKTALVAFVSIAQIVSPQTHPVCFEILNCLDALILARNIRSVSHMDIHE